MARGVVHGWKTEGRYRAARGLALAFLITLAGLILPIQASAQSETFRVTGELENQSLIPAIRIARAMPESATQERILNGEFDTVFEAQGSAVPNLDWREGPVWVRTVVHNTSDAAFPAQIVLKYPQPRQIDFFVERQDGGYNHYAMGSAVALTEPLSGRFPHAPVTIPAGQTRTIYLKLESNGPILIPLQIYSQAEFGRVMTWDYLVFGLMIGVIVAIAGHALLTFFATRDPASGWFAVFALAGAGFIAQGTGIAKAMIWPDIAFHSNALIIVVQGIANGASALFLAYYLSTRDAAPKTHRLIKGLAFIAFASSFTTPLPYILTWPFLFIGLLVAPPLLFALTVYFAWKRIEGARALLLGWAMIQAGTAWIFLRALDLVPYTEFNHYALPIAVTITAVHFSWALARRTRQAEHHATHDALTGLPNRFKLEMIDSKTAIARGRVAGVLQIDLDGFKAVNDTLGHAAGDEVLRTVSKRIDAAVHGAGKAYRLGGDEFVVIASATRNGVNLVALANRIIVAASQPIRFRDETAHIGASVGLAIPASRHEDISALLERADAALYKAKNAGKGRVEFSDVETQRATLEEAMKRVAA